MNKYEKAHLAMENGYKIATGLQSGDVFHGGATLALNLYDEGSLEYRMFIDGYIRGLDERFGDGVQCDLVKGSDGTELWLIK